MANTVHMGAGSLNRLIAIEQFHDVNDGAGGVTTRTYSPFLTVYAKVEPHGGSESFYSGELYPKANYTVTIRYRLGIVYGMRVRYGSHTYRIRSVSDKNDEHVFLELRCEELQAEGNVQ